jgi:subtilisin family serine protease
VAGIVAGNNGPAGAPSGVAKAAGLISVQVFSQFSGSGYCGSNTTCPQAYESDLVSGLQHVYDLRNTYNIASVKMSLGGGQYFSACDSDWPSFKTAVDNLRLAGIATVIASGNNGYTNSISFPACISSAISVGATDKSDVVASYSNSASFLNLLAPGSSIYSSLLNAGYGYLSGTSMATPHVAGAWAVLKSAKPTATVSEVLTALVNTGKPITDARNSITKPRIQVDQAVYALVPFTISDSVVNGVGGTITSSASTVPYGGNVTYTITPDTGYTLTGLTDNGVNASAIEGPAGTFTYSISNVTANHAVIATFAVAAASAVSALPPFGLSAAILIAAVLGYGRLPGMRKND